MKTPTFLFLFMVSLSVVDAQPCNSTTQQEVIHANNIRSVVLNGGDNFWDLENAQFKVPYTGPESPSIVFATGLWLGAIDNSGNLRVSAIDYRNSTSCGYTAGPIFLSQARPNDQDLENWDKIFSVHQFDILKHKEDFNDGVIDQPIDAIFGWPAAGNIHFERIHGFPLELEDQGAGFHELPNSTNGIYEPELGEFPHIEGMDPDVAPGEIKWCVYSAQSTENSTHTSPLLYEIQQTVYAMTCSESSLSNTLFVRYRIINKSKEKNNNVVMGQWMDPDLGCYTDDYIGCDPEKNTVFSYNVDDIDGTQGNDCNGGIPTYDHPPVSTLTFLNKDLSYLSTYNNPIVQVPIATSDPQTAEEHYNYMRGLWRDGTPLTRGGNGYNPGSTDTVLHAYPDRPTDLNGWSMAQENLGFGDRRVVASTEIPFFSDKEIWTIDLAFGYFNDGISSAWDMVDVAMQNVEEIQDAYDQGFSICPVESCTCECVWPGDADNNGQVNYLDLINIVRSLNSNGNIRPNGLAWKGHEVDDWLFSLPRGTNAKHSDVNGDGQIDETDFSFFDEYLNRTNACFTAKDDICEQGDDMGFTISLGDSLFASRAFKRMNINLYADEDFEGITYEIRYDADLLDLGTIGGSLPFPNQAKQYRFDYNSIIGNEGHLEIVQMTTSGQDERLNEPIIGNLVLIGRQQPERYPTPYTEIRICNPLLHKADGSTVELKSQRFRYWFDDSVITSTDAISAPLDFSIFPNPSNGQVTVLSSNSTGRLIIMDNMGRPIQTHRINDNVTMLDLSNLNPGMYFIRLENSGRIAVKKLIKK